MPVASTVPDPDMPKSSKNIAQSNTLYAHLADIRSGWKRAPLTDKERRSLLLKYGLDWSGKDIAEHEQCGPDVISVRLFRGVGKVMATMNGSVFTEGEQATTEEVSTIG